MSAEAREEYALDGDVLCLRMLRSSNVVAISTADGVVGVRDETTEVRCVRP